MLEAQMLCCKLGNPMTATSYLHQLQWRALKKLDVEETSKEHDPICT